MTFRKRTLNSLVFQFSFILLIAVARAQSDDSQDERQFLDVPGTRLITPAHDIPELSVLPSSLIKALAIYDWGNDDHSVPTVFRGFIYDLKKDGRGEYFLCNRGYSGSGGAYWMVFGEFKNGWRLIGEFGGSVHAFPCPTHWPKLVSIGRGGGGVWTKIYSEFKNGKYEDTLLERYDRGEITKETLPRK